MNTDFIYANTLNGLDTTVYKADVPYDYNIENGASDENIDWIEIDSYHA